MTSQCENRSTHPRKIWVFQEAYGSPRELAKVNRGLLCEANDIARRVSGDITAVVLTDNKSDYPAFLRQYGMSSVSVIIEHPLLKDFSAEIYSRVLSEHIHQDRPWLFMMGDTAAGRELAPRLAVALQTGLISNCVKMNLRDLDKPRFFRPVCRGQLYQEIEWQSGETVLVTMDLGALNVLCPPEKEETNISVNSPIGISEDARMKHVGYLPVDVQTADLASANTIVSIGMGATTSDILPLAEELAGLLRGTIGATRPVVDQGAFSTERMIGQTGRVVAPDFYLALGISGASQHVAGIQNSGTILSINRDPRAAIFEKSDYGAVADLKDILPGLIERIKQAKTDGKIL